MSIAKNLSLSSSMVRLALAPFRDDAVGAERLPTRGPLLLAANHQSFLDGALVACDFVLRQHRPLHMIAYDEPFHNWFLGYFLRRGRCLPFRRGDAADGCRMLGVAAAYLARGEAVGIFPEGHINDRATLRSARPGAAVLALWSGAPVAPVGLVGTDRVLRHGKRWPDFRARARVVYGEPLDFSAESAAYRAAIDDPDARAELIDRTTRAIMDGIARLCGKHPPKS